jgi:hypothetical protein
MDPYEIVHEQMSNWKKSPNPIFDSRGEEEYSWSTAVGASAAEEIPCPPNDDR